MKETTEENRSYYIYRHLKGQDGSGGVFYIGRGKHTKNATFDTKLYARAYDKGKRSNAWKNTFNKYGRYVEIMLDNLTYQESIEKEVEFITLYGRRKNGGTLCNLTDGGEGSVNFKHSAESLQKMRDKATPLDQKIPQSYVKRENGCWEWTGTIISGRPILWSDGHNHHAKRALYCYYKNTTLKKNQHVHSTCDNPICVNPSHQEVHYAAKSIRDKSPLTEDDVKEIKRLAYFEGVTHADLAKKYGMRRPIITKILLGTNWGWVKVEGIPDVIKSTYHKEHKKPIFCEETGEVYASAKEAAIAVFGTDKDFRTVRMVCSKPVYKGHYKGYHFRFAA